MKKTILTSIMAVCVLASQAQETNPSTIDSYRPQAGEKQFSFGLFNNSSFFALKKYKTPKRATRFGISGFYSTESSYSSNKYPNYSYSYLDPNYSVSYQEQKTKTSDYRIYAFLGFQFGFGDFKNFEPYLGMDFSLGNSFQNRDMYNETFNTNSSTVYLMETRNVYKSYLNPSFSVLPFIGFNYYLGERFALGAEYRVSIANITYNDKAKSETYHQYSDGTSYNFKNNNNHSVRTNGSFTGSAYITATLFINSSKK